MKLKVNIEVKEAKEGPHNVRHIHIHFPQDYFISRGETLVFSPYNREEIQIIERPDDYCFDCDNNRKVFAVGVGFNGLVERKCPTCCPQFKTSK